MDRKLSTSRFPMIITCLINNPTKVKDLLERLLERFGYVKITEQAYVHQGGEQLTATVAFRKTYLPEIDAVRVRFTLTLSDAGHTINQDLCFELSKTLSFEPSCSEAFSEQHKS